MFMEPHLAVSSRRPPRTPLPSFDTDREDVAGQIVVAVVDDDPAVRESTRMLLEIYGFSTRTYQSGADFLNEMPQVGCVIVDYMMPDLNGLALVAALRKQGFDAPTIMITATGDQSLERRAADLGIGQVLRKPLALQSLLSAIRKAAGEGPR